MSWERGGEVADLSAPRAVPNKRGMNRGRRSEWDDCRTMPLQPTRPRRRAADRRRSACSTERSIQGNAASAGAKELIRREGVQHVVRMFVMGSANLGDAVRKIVGIKLARRKGRMGLGAVAE
jgi:hypothetical protein